MEWLSYEICQSLEKMSYQVLEILKIEIPIKDSNKVIYKNLEGEIEIVTKTDSYFDKFKVAKKGESFIIRKFATETKKDDNYKTAIAFGKLFITMSYLVDNKEWNTFKDYDFDVPYKNYTQSKYVDYFAMCLLLPEQEFLIQLHKFTNINHEVDLDKISDYFNVPLFLVKNRLNSLGYKLS